jgi:RNA 2',3'-cyclic 3'-phosphodiesterase
MSRLFLAVWPTDEVVAELRALPRKDRRGVRFVDPDSWHVTLRFLGEADTAQVIDCIDGLEARCCRAHVGPGVDVLGERALIVPVSGADALAGEVTQRTEHLGEPPRRRFHGHLTLARLAKGAQPPPAMGMYVDVDFDIDHVALVESRLHPDGARYETLETWTLRGSS